MTTIVNNREGAKLICTIPKGWVIKGLFHFDGKVNIATDHGLFYVENEKLIPAYFAINGERTDDMNEIINFGKQ